MRMMYVIENINVERVKSDFRAEYEPGLAREQVEMSKQRSARRVPLLVPSARALSLSLCSPACFHLWPARSPSHGRSKPATARPGQPHPDPPFDHSTSFSNPSYPHVSSDVPWPTLPPLAPSSFSPQATNFGEHPLLAYIPIIESS